MTRYTILVAAFLGGAAGIIFGAMDKLERRVQALEARPRSSAISPDQSHELRRNFQRDSARDFVGVLKEEGLVIAPDPEA